jgi:hypothetical protein
MRSIVGLALVAGVFVAGSMPVHADKIPVAELAKKLSGMWAFNQDLSPEFSRPGSRGGGGAVHFQTRGASRFQTVERYPQGVRANPTNTEPTSSKADDLTPAERAESAALFQVAEIPPMFTVAATPSQVSFSDDRGDWSCDINGKTTKVRLFGTYLDVKCRWDKDWLRQEISTARTKLVRSWTVDERELLVLKTKVESFTQNTREATAYFDRVR